MTTFDYILLMLGGCGVILVLGSMGLLHKGVIKLSTASSKEAVSIQFKQTIRVTSHYPAIALFIVGLTGVSLAAFMAKPSTVRPLALEGNIKARDLSSVRIEVTAGLCATKPATDGRVIDTISPQVKEVLVEIKAPGCNPESRKFGTKEIASGKAALGDIVLDQKIEMPEVSPENIKPATVSLPPLSAPGGFN